jgi:Asp-tRNA(Asn)/Glu-tRNA(Gln) amidotransferase C subunit
MDRLKRIGLGLGILLLVSTAWSQTPVPQSSTQDQKSASDSKATGSSSAAKPENKISPKDAEELFQEVDQILQFVSKDTAFPVKHEVKRHLASRDEVSAYLQKSLREDKDAKRLRRTELVLKKFGLLPRDFDFQSSIVALLREQVAGYYDQKTKTMNLLDWVSAEQQRSVIAHELTHALQDQSFGLGKWLSHNSGDLDKRKDITPADIEKDEADETLEAVVEGQAEAVMVDYLLEPTGRSVWNAPEVLAELDADMLKGDPDSVVFKNAPIFLKESLTFPYRYGVEFVAAMGQDGGKPKAFAGLFKNPPRTTRQIMEPKTYLAGEQIEPLPVPNFREIFKKYDRFDVGAMGEFDVSMLIDQYAGTETSHSIYPFWRGGYYYAARPKGDANAPLGLLYVSRWATAEKAAQFAAVYAKSLAKRYQHVQEVAEDGTKSAASFEKLQTWKGPHHWMTEDGAVVVEVEGDKILVTESLDAATTIRLSHDVFAPNSH